MQEFALLCSKLSDVYFFKANPCSAILLTPYLIVNIYIDRLAILRNTGTVMANFVSQLFISFHTSENIYFLFWFAPTKNFLICFFYYSWTQV